MSDLNERPSKVLAMTLLAIRYSTSSGWVLDPLRALQQSLILDKALRRADYGESASSQLQYIPRRNYFYLAQPYTVTKDVTRIESEANISVDNKRTYSVVDQEPCNSQLQTRQRKRRKKETAGSHNRMQAVMDYYDSIKKELLNGYDELVTRAKSIWPMSAKSELYNDKNVETEIELDLVALGESVRLVRPSCDQNDKECALFAIPLQSEQTILLEHLFDTVYTNESNKNITRVIVLGHTYLIPPQSTFLMSDIVDIGRLYTSIASSAPYNLVLIDPPWSNASAIRASAYSTMDDCYSLYKLPIRELLGQRDSHTPAMVAVWLTNRTKYRRFLLNQLLPAWGVGSITAEWWWIKVANDGQPVVPFDSTHRRPYETLLVGVRGMNQSSNETDTIPHEKRVLCSPPAIGQHSRKPCVHTLLLELFTSRFGQHVPIRPLELFARSLVAGWTGWGNEVIRFQSTAFWLPVSVLTNTTEL